MIAPNIVKSSYFLYNHTNSKITLWKMNSPFQTSKNCVTQTPRLRETCSRIITKVLDDPWVDANNGGNPFSTPKQTSNIFVNQNNSNSQPNIFNNQNNMNPQGNYSPGSDALTQEEICLTTSRIQPSRTICSWTRPLLKECNRIRMDSKVSRMFPIKINQWIYRD